MKTIFASIFAAVLCSAILFAQSADKNRSEAERYIAESERQWTESVATGDVSVIERILADDFIGVDPDGKQYNKAEMVRDTKDAPKHYASNHLNQVTVRFYGDAGVAQRDESWVRRNGKRGRFVWTDTWVKRNGKWQIVAAERPDRAGARTKEMTVSDRLISSG